MALSRISPELVRQAQQSFGLDRSTAIKLWKYINSLQDKNLLTPIAIPLPGKHAGHRVIFVNAARTDTEYGCCSCNRPAGKFGDPIPPDFHVVFIEQKVLPPALRGLTIALTHCQQCFEERHPSAAEPEAAPENA